MGITYSDHNDNSNNNKNISKRLNYAFTAMPIGIARLISGDAMRLLQEIMMSVFQHGKCTLSLLTLKQTLGLAKNTLVKVKKELIDKGIIYETKKGIKTPSELTLNCERLEEIASSMGNPASHRQFLEHGQKSRMEVFKEEQKQICLNKSQNLGQNLTQIEEAKLENEIPMVKIKPSDGQNLTKSWSKSDLDHGQNLTTNKDPKNLKNIIKINSEKNIRNLKIQNPRGQAWESIPKPKPIQSITPYSRPAIKMTAGAETVDDQIEQKVKFLQSIGINVPLIYPGESKFEYFRRLEQSKSIFSV